MATKPKTTDLLAAWDETVVTVHMSVGKFRKMDEVYRENRDLYKQLEEKSEIIDCMNGEYNKLTAQIAAANQQAKEAKSGDDEPETHKEMLKFMCEGILASLDAENGIAIKDPATLLSLFMEARAWLLKADENPSII